MCKKKVKPILRHQENLKEKLRKFRLQNIWKSLFLNLLTIHILFLTKHSIFLQINLLKDFMISLFNALVFY